MIIIDQATVGAQNIIRLRDLLIEAQGISKQLNRQISTSTATDIEMIHGIPAENAAAYAPLMTNIQSALDSEPVETLLSSIA